MTDSFRTGTLLGVDGAGWAVTETDIVEYYRRRAGEYDQIYMWPAWQDDLAWLWAWTEGHTRGRRVLEVAAGTGYWTQCAAQGALHVTATDANEAALAVARERCAGLGVTFETADAYALPAGSYDVVMAYLWWSHVELQLRGAFVAQVAGLLAPGGTLLMVDESADAAAVRDLATRWDGHGNRYEARRTADGGRFEIVKNYPGDAEIEASLREVFGGVSVARRGHFWAVHASLDREG